MAWVDELRAIQARVEQEQSTKPDAKRPIHDVLRRLRGRQGPHGTEWLTSDEIAHRLGLRPGDKLRPIMAKVHREMDALGWKPAIVGTGRVRCRGFTRPVPLADVGQLSPHHGAATAAILDALRRLAPLGLSGADLDRAYDAARDALPAADGSTAPVPPSALAAPPDRAEGIGPVPHSSTWPVGPGTATSPAEERTAATALPLSPARAVEPAPCAHPARFAAILDRLGPPTHDGVSALRRRSE